MNVIFVAGTDTGAGKTVVTGAFAAALGLKGFRVAVMKPVSCGGLEDAHFLIRHSGCKEKMSVINPIALKSPLSPNVAASLEKKKLTFQPILRAFSLLRQKNYDYLLIEGCGGLLVPLTDKLFVIDLIKKMKARTLLVSRSGLGAINHSLLSLEALKHRGIKPLGVIFNRLNGGSLSIPEATNPAVVSRLGRVPALGVFPFVKISCQSDCLGKAFLKHIDLSKLL